MQTTIAERRALTEKRKPTRDWQGEIFAMLPDDCPAPTISNEKENFEQGRPGAWLSFRAAGFGQEGKTGSEILKILEDSGFKTMPASVARYGQWRESVHFGLVQDLPETSSRAELENCEPIMPLWIRPNQYGDPEAGVFYEAPNGMIFRVKVPAPTKFRLSAERREIKGDWHYVRGTAKVYGLDAYHALEHEGEHFAHLRSAGAHVDTAKGLNAQVFWTLIAHEPESFPLTGSQMLAKFED